MIMEISHLIHVLSLRGTDITFCWIPSHLSFYYNDKVDRAAKRGANVSPDSCVINLPLSIQESYAKVENYLRKQFQDSQVKYDNHFINYDIHKVSNQFNIPKISSL